VEEIAVDLGLVEDKSPAVSPEGGVALEASSASDEQTLLVPEVPAAKVDHSLLGVEGLLVLEKGDFQPSIGIAVLELEGLLAVVVQLFEGALRRLQGEHFLARLKSGKVFVTELSGHPVKQHLLAVDLRALLELLLQRGPHVVDDQLLEVAQSGQFLRVGVEAVGIDPDPPAAEEGVEEQQLAVRAALEGELEVAKLVGLCVAIVLLPSALSTLPLRRRLSIGAVQRK
jgi:hypothetical protein